ncbi:hypothetical protein PC118_g14363 [Phytophthora cactorum]|uniref:Uncharacterized protein n=1 Tax=Phytophthora cactorum TaxID=29920 RepID=A0A8T0YV06_9STRA|nr:hypothetical protein PC112_g14295 [Phytophthora cactorum]KAG2816141.1 hypothetical protein PC111_g13264 [Phytophthora cactorum]KAG2853004.1 hypothetical protein PC113_g14542 [Phytophthora cactorum]KAG2895307.1 hypothetical protein PC114_g15533 [Phytophthora cactorum]KAG2926175.1 hypothetical protein PC117_g14955 [Phytophthora cactorum]
MPNPTPWSPEEDLGEDDATSRKTGALQSRWAGLIRPDVALYASCVAVLHLRVRAEDHSGWTEKDYADEAANRFTAKRELLNANAFHDYEEGLMSGSTKGSARFMRNIPRPRKRPRLQSGLQTNELEAEDNSDAADMSSVVDDNEGEPCVNDFQSPVGSLQISRPTSAGKKKAKMLHLEGEVDKAIMHSQR